jgi:hypothetical protein
VKKVDYKSRRKYIGTDRYREQLPKQNSKGSASKRNNEQMGLHQTKSFCTAKETVTRLKRQSTEWEKNLYQLFIRSGTNIQNLQGTQKAQPPKNQHPSEEIGT